MPSHQTRDPIPAPFIVSPTYEFDGDDGYWSTFTLQVGTPAQSFRVLPATVGEEIWIPVDGACEGPLSGLSDCGSLRGADGYLSAPSRGFLINNSTTWKALGGSIYVLSTEQNLFPSNDGLYGQDTVSLGSGSSGGENSRILNQVVAGVTTETFWLGNLGLGTAPGSFSSQESSIPSLLVSMKAQSLATSLSYGYTAGQSYASPPLSGSLILGGYDQARLGPSTVSVPINSNAKPQTLDLTIQSIVASNTLGGSTVSLITSPIVANVDSATSQIWLPDQACQIAAQAFGLILDANTGLFLINGTIHKQLQASNPSIAFTIGGSSSGPSTTIQMHYNALDLRVGIPLYNASTPYFPIRRAANASQITLGRAFLQEAYIVVDWERSNLTIGQAIAQNKTTNIVPLLPPSSSQTPTVTDVPHPSDSAVVPASAPSGLQGGAIAGIVVAMIVIIAGLAGFAWFVFRRRRRSAKLQEGYRTADGGAGAPEVTFGVVEHYADDVKDAWKSSDIHVSERALGTSELEDTPNGSRRKPMELASAQVHELPASDSPVVERELMSSPLMELEGNLAGSELDVTKTDLTATRPTAQHRGSDGTVSLISATDSRPQSPNVRASTLSGTTVGEARESLRSPVSTALSPVSTARQSVFREME